MVTSKQQKFITALIQLGNLQEACDKVDITTRTYYNWLKIPKFEQELKKQQDEVYNSSIVDMKTLFTKAVETQQKLLNSENESIKLRTSAIIVNNTMKMVETKSVQERIKQLEHHMLLTEGLRDIEAHYDETRIENIRKKDRKIGNKSRFKNRSDC